MGGAMKRSGVKILSAAVVAGAAIFAAFAVFGSLTSPEIVKLNPASLSVESSGAWVEDASAWAVLDRDTATAYAPAPALTRLLVTLPAETDLKTLKVYGPAAYDLKVYEVSSGSWKLIPGLDSISLKAQAISWNTFTPTASTRVKSLMLELSPVGGNAGGVKEIEVWGTDAGDPHITLNGIKTSSEMQAVLAASPRPAHIAEFSASPAQLDVPADRNTYTVSFTVTTDSKLVKRAYLLYDTYNAEYLINPEKSLNGGSWTGGFTVTSDTPRWVTQLEEINPSWLAKGENKVDFRNLVQGRDPSSYFVRNVKVLAELDNGWNGTSALEGTAGDPAHGPAAAYDGDTTTYFELSGANTLDIKTDRSVQPDTIKLNLWSASGSPAGKLTIQYLQGSQWKSFASGGTIDLSTLHDGWNDIAVPAKVAADSLRLAFEVPGDRRRGSVTVGGVTEVRLVGSPIGNKPSRGLVLTYPLAGEFFGRTAFLQGFIDPANNGSGAVQTSIEGKDASMPDGVVALSLSKDETRFASQNDNDAWEAAVSASYPDGTSFARTVALNKNILNTDPTNDQDSGDTSATTREKFTDKVAPGQAKKIQYKGVTLDIPEGAVDKELEITIMPLTEADLNRLNPGMIDVTSPDAGYRFLPQGTKFKKPIKISFGYGKEFFAAGQVDDEVFMYYYDEALQRWQKLSRVKVDAGLKQVTSESDHFTDIINSTLVVPEHPQALTFNPTSIKDIKAADPSANIDLIEPPTANNKGTANLSYPIEIPKGRGAYTPDLRITYSSTNANGWMGLGWDIPIPSIQVDTKWGVPMYDPDKETESYLLSGQRLAPVFKLFDNPPTPREANRRFYKRVEGDFFKIVRTGNSPSTYSWEVTDKSGVKYYYGVTAQARLADYKQGNENIFQWFLEKVVDTNGNVTEYTYYHDTQAAYLASIGNPANSPKNALGGEDWTHLYLDKIAYTKNEKTGAPAQYAVEFIRDAGNRKDITVNGKSGFKTALRFRLDRVDVRFKGGLVRSYQMNYAEGDFAKSLLDKITVRDANGTEFYGHGFDYYALKRGGIGYFGFTDAEKWYTPNSGPFSRSDENAHSRGRYEGRSYVPMRALSRGTLSGYSNTDSNTVQTFQDINGDGLPDLVFPGMVHYNQSGPDGQKFFGLPSGVPGLPLLEQEYRRTASMGSATYLYAYSHSEDLSNTISMSRATLSDMNGDGLVDLVGGGGVFYNHVPEDGRFIRNDNWVDTPADGDTSDLERADKARFHLVDPLRKWKAPFAGDIMISGSIQKKKREDAAESDNTDGDGVALYVYRENTELGRLVLAADDYAAHPLGAVTGDPGSDHIDLSGMQAGERIYFRLNSVDNGENDEVIFDPVITYTAAGNLASAELQTLKDPSGRPLYAYQASTDFSTTNTQETLWGSRYKGTMAFTARIDKRETLDDVHITIKRSTNQDYSTWDTVYKEYNLPAADVEIIDINETLTVEEGERFLITVTSDRMIDPSRVAMTAEAVFTDVEWCDVNEAFTRYECSTKHVDNPDETDKDGDPMYRFRPQVNYIYTPLLQAAVARTWVAPYSGKVRVTGDVVRSVSGERATARILGVNKPIWTQTISSEPIPSGETLSYPHSILMDITQGDQLFFEVQSKDSLGGAVSWAPTVTYAQYCPSGPASCTTVTCNTDPDGITTCTPPGREFIFRPEVEYYHTDPNADDEPFGGGFRHWYFGQWNGNEAWDQAKLVARDYDSDDENAQPEYFVRMDPSDGGTAFSGGTPVWTTDEDRSFVSATGFSSSRMFGAVNYKFRSGAVNRMSSSFSVTNGRTFYVGGNQESYGFTNTHIDLLDFNGDGLADQVTPKGIKLNDGKKGFTFPISVSPGTFRQAFNDNHGFNLGAGSIANVVSSAGKALGVSGKSGSSSGTGGFDIIQMILSLINIGTVRGDTTGKVDLRDMNGDGLPDLVYQGSTSVLTLGDATKLSVMLNLGNRFGDVEEWRIETPAFMSENSIRTISFNMGYDVLGVVGASRGLKMSVSRVESDLADVNGDGLPDIVSKKSENDFMSVRINQGGSFGPEQLWIIPSWQLQPPKDKKDLQIFSWIFGMVLTSEYLDDLLFNNDTLRNTTIEAYSYGFNVNGYIRTIKKPPYFIRGRENGDEKSYVKSQVEFRDIDGDGLPDHVYKATGTNEIEVKRNLTGKANLLRAVHRSLGGKFTLEYARKGNKVDYSNPDNIIDMPHSYWVLSKVKLNDGMKTSGGQPKHVYTTTYSYGSGYYSRAEREFYGFRRVSEARGEDGEKVTVVNTYHNQDYYQKGLLLSSETKSGDEDGPAWVSTTNEYDVRPEAVIESKFPYLAKTTTNYYDVAAQAVQKSTSQEYKTYDQYGNILEYVDQGEPGTDSDNVLASIRYDQSNVSEYIVNRPTSIEVRDSSNRIYRSRSAHYEPGTGNLKDLSMLVGQGKNVTWNMTYYPDGNLLTITAPAGDPGYNLKTDGYRLTYAYDPETQTYVTGISDSFGYGSSADYDYRFGQPATQKDINGNIQVNVYDDFGRLARVCGPYYVNSGSTEECVNSSAPALEFKFYPVGLDEDNLITTPASALTKNRAESIAGVLPDTLDTITFADGLKRIIQTKKEADVNNNHGMVVSGTVVFDSLGRVVEQDQPTFFAGTSYAYVPNLSRKHPANFTYDTLDRTTLVKTPDGAITTTAYGFGAPPQGGGTMFKTTVMDGNNYVTIPGTGKGIKISYKDSHDRIMAVEEHQKGSFIPTKYAYNILGEITNVTDAKGNQTNIVYDLLGRRLSIDNKDTGLTTYTYDANGNVTTKETANLKTGAKLVKYVYDYNRLFTIDYPNSVDVVYEYGDPTEAGDTKGNLAGRIKRVTDESGEELRYYGRLGETVKELRQINAKNNPVARMRYETRYAFDSFGRMKEMTYPDGETLYYVYDGGGLLKQAYGKKRGNTYDYIKNLAYDEFGQRTDIQYGNNVRTTYTYNQLNRRLANLKSVEPTKGRVIQNIDYQYDMVGNIMNTINGAPVPAGGEIGGPTKQYFTYDDLYQLETANGEHRPAPGKRTSYTSNLYYDTIGNITRKVQTHLIIGDSGSTQEPRETNYVLDYKYLTNGSTKPHAVTDAGDKFYTYDQNGNMAGWTSKTTTANRIIIWNEENRVKSIADSGSATEFLYDDAGERAVKGGGGNETVYLNRFYSLKNGDLGSKHIFSGETRVCTKVEKDGGSIQSGVPGSGAFVVSQGLRNALQQGNPLAPKKGINRRLPGAAGAAAVASPPIEKFEFFYHGDHLGSSNFITDDSGQVYQELEYFPYGESWVEDGGSGQMPYYRFTGKELDPETGLYYFGARYYDPVLSRWISADPAIDKYLPNLLDKKQQGKDWNPEKKLPGMGGVFSPLNLNLYGYTHQNPVKLIDPDGRVVKVTSHEVFHSGNRHAAALLIPDDQSLNWGAKGFKKNDQGQWYATLSAGPQNGLLKKDFNRSTDAPTKNRLEGVAKNPFGKDKAADTKFINSLLEANKNYGDNLSYGLFPGPNTTSTIDTGDPFIGEITITTEEYNSNSFLSGLLKSVGSEVPKLTGTFPGIDKPVPSESFKPKE